MHTETHQEQSRTGGRRPGGNHELRIKTTTYRPPPPLRPVPNDEPKAGRPPSAEFSRPSSQPSWSTPQHGKRAPRPTRPLPDRPPTRSGACLQPNGPPMLCDGRRKAKHMSWKCRVRLCSSHVALKSPGVPALHAPAQDQDTTRRGCEGVSGKAMFHLSDAALRRGRPARAARREGDAMAQHETSAEGASGRPGGGWPPAVEDGRLGSSSSPE